MVLTTITSRNTTIDNCTGSSSSYYKKSNENGKSSSNGQHQTVIWRVDHVAEVCKVPDVVVFTAGLCVLGEEPVNQTAVSRDQPICTV